MNSLWSVSANDGEGSLELSLLEGERIFATYVEHNRLCVHTNLDRTFKSTDTKMPYFDMIEETDV